MKKAPRYKKPSIIPLSSIIFHFLYLFGIGKKIYRIFVLLVILVSGIIGIFTSQNWILIITVVGFIVGLYDWYSAYFKTSNLRITESRELPRLFRTIKPSKQEEESGYVNYYIDDRQDSILMSKKVNCYLRNHARQIQVVLKPNQFKKISSRLKSKADFYKNILVFKNFESRKENKMFSNDKKISLLTTIIPNIQRIFIFESCYYLSYLTNDLSTFDVEDSSDPSSPDSLWSGIDNFPYEPGNTPNNHRLKSLESSFLSNHIGGNTIAITNSGRLALWRQGRSALRSVGLLAPTGSGSLDYEDYKVLNRKNLAAMVIKGMERELLEECHTSGSEIRNIIRETKIIGFYRWVGKAGLPGFLGITKLNVEMNDMTPNISEVDNPKKIQTDYPAENLIQLRETVDELMNSPNLSVPLYANLFALKDVIENDSEYLNFLFL